MSQISIVHTALIDRIASVLPDYRKIANPYEITNNPGSILNKGFAVAIGEAVNTQRTVKALLFELRTFEVFLIRLATHTENNVSKRVSLEQEIMEDAFSIKKDLEIETQLGGECISITYISDSGLQYIVPEGEEASRDKYYALNLVFDCEYREDLTL